MPFSLSRSAAPRISIKKVTVGSALLLVAILLLLVSGTARAGAATLYWTHDATNGDVGRTNIDGTGVEPDFIEGVGGSLGLAVDGSNIYWGQNANGVEGIGRANLAGGERSLFAYANPVAVAVDSQHVFTSESSLDSIGSMTLDGSTVDEELIPDQNGYGIAVSGGKVYWGDIGNGTIGRANLDGSGVEPAFLTGVGEPVGVAAGYGHIYWTDIDTGSIGRANINGSEVEMAFISTPSPWGIALTPEPAVTPTPAPSPPVEKVKVTPTPAPTGTTCGPVTTSASTYLPPVRPGRVVAGLRTRLGVSTPSRLRVEPTLSYGVKGKVRTVALAAASVHVSSPRNLRFALPANLRAALPFGTKVGLRLRIGAIADYSGACTTPNITTKTLRLPVVKVLTAP